jgi:hypothetical protein
MLSLVRRASDHIREWRSERIPWVMTLVLAALLTKAPPPPWG